MSQNPLNLALRIFLEMAALVAIGYGGWHAMDGWLRYLLAIGLLVIAAFLWGAFRPPNEPFHHGKAAPFAVSGKVRLLIEAVVFGGGAWGLFSSGATTLGWLYSLLVIGNYAISYDRVGWLLRN